MSILPQDPPQFVSPTRTAYAVRCTEDFDVGKPPCNGGELIYLTDYGYNAQMSNPDVTWRCPMCGGSASWSDRNFDEFYDQEAVADA